MEFHSWILHVCHTAVTFLLSICSYWTSFASKFQFQNATKELNSLPTGYYTIPQADAIRFYGMKTPLHLGLLVLEDTYCVAAIALVVSLAYTIGVRHISVYSKGWSQADFFSLEKKVQQLLSQRHRSKSAVPSINVQHILSPKPRNTDGSELNVNIVNPGDGTRMLVEVTRTIARRLKLGTITSQDISTEYVDKLLQELTQCPDPDMVLKFGAAPSTCGYLPWQLRLTEIVSMQSLRTFSPFKFKRALQSFSKIEQRFGK